MIERLGLYEVKKKRVQYKKIVCFTLQVHFYVLSLHFEEG